MEHSRRIIKLPDSWKDADEQDLEDSKCRRYSEYVAEVAEEYEEFLRDQKMFENGG